MTATDAIVLGAGPSGLAVAACLKTRGAHVAVIERNAQVGSSWRNHYERLHLHTAKRYSSLPMMPFPDDVPMYPSRAQVVEYLERYATRFGIEPHFGETAHAARYDGNRWIVPTSRGEYHARSLVVATGYNRVPNIPAIPGRDRFRGTIVHSGEYRNGRAFRGKRALVVGAGNSGAEIALDLWESGATTAISIRGPVHVVPRDLLGIPAQYNAIHFFSRIPPALADRLSLMLVQRVYGDLSRYGITRPTLGPISQVVHEKRIPLIDIGTIALVKQGKIRVHPGPREFTGEGVRFDDGHEAPFDLVVLATGYRAGLDGVLADARPHLDARGYPLCFGKESATPGLYFIGYRNPLEGALYDIGREAERVAAEIATNLSRS
jgi:cation diffusion facilitator CzcD-associated flavoprotein CzcO